MRINGTSCTEIERFVLATSGQHLSVRQIDQLCGSCFGGDPELREQILAGRFELVLRENEQPLELRLPLATLPPWGNHFS
jgi:hypothetical protein